MRTRLTLLAFLLGCFVHGFSQNQANIWYFGYNAGIDFNTGSAVAIGNGQVFSAEGGSSVCDPMGNLLFYSDGLSVWNRNHVIMPNGSGLLGGQSSTTSAIIVPRPNHCTQYYLFTVEDHQGVNNSFRYTVVDMALNGGLGDVVLGQKNVLINTPCAEKITALRHANGVDYWIITRTLGNNIFWAYQLTPAGLNMVGVQSAAGAVNASNCMIGFLKANHSGTKLVAAQTFCSNVEMYDFNKLTGVVSNPLTIPSAPGWVYGIEFSPNDQILYLNQTFGGSSLRQVDVNNLANFFTLSSIPGNYNYGGLQLGPDGVIYMARNNQPFVGTVSNPDVWGFGCNFNPSGFNLFPGTTSGVGMVSYPPEYPLAFNPNPSGFTVEDTCLGSLTTFNGQIVVPADSVTWTFGDPGSGVLNLANGDTVQHQYGLPGTYVVTMIIHGCYPDTLVDTITISPIAAVNLGPDTLVCNGALPILLDAGAGYGTYLWSTGDTTQTTLAATGGVYWVEVDGCSGLVRDSINVQFGAAITSFLGPDTALCVPFSLQLGPVNGVTTTVWSTGSNNPSIQVNAGGTYWAEVSDSIGCTFRDSILVTAQPLPTVNLPAQASVCPGQPVQLDAGVSGMQYLWLPINANTQTVMVSTPGTYTVQVSNSCGTVSDSILVVNGVAPVVSLGNDSVICAGQAFLLNAGPGFASYAWSNGTNGSTISVGQTGVYSVTVTNAQGCPGSDTVVLGFSQPPSVTVNVTAVSCFGSSNGSASATINGLAPFSYHWTTPGNPSSPSVGNLPPGTYSLVVLDSVGCSTTQSFTVASPLPMLLTGVVSPPGCMGQNNGSLSIQVAGGQSPYTFAWSTGAGGSTINNLAPGSYSVTVTDQNGCSTDTLLTVPSIPNPVANAGANVSFCEGEGGAILNVTASSGTPTYYYTWWCATPPCGLDSMYDDDPLANPAVSQWYYVQVTDGNGCQSNVDSVYVTILPKPVVDAGPDVLLCGDQAPCEILTPTITGAPGPYTFHWSPGSSLNDSTIMNPCARPDTTMIYALIVTAGNGCTSDFTTTDTLATVTVFVHPVPIAEAGPERDICYGDTTQLQGIATNAGPSYSFQWTPSGALSDSAAVNPYAFPPMTTNYSLVVWSNGCPSYADSVLVNVHTLPTVDAGWDQDLCPGDSLRLDAQASGDSTTTYSYHWWPSTAIVGSDTLEDPLAQPSQTTTLYVQATSGYGCGSALDSVLLTLLPAPQAEAGPNLLLCPGDTIQLSGSYTYATGDSATPGLWYYNWSPGLSLSDTTAEDPWAWPSSSTLYTLEINYGICRTMDSVLVTVGPAALASPMPDTTVICAGDSVRLDGSASLGAQVQWLPTTGLAAPNSATTMAAPGATTTYSLVMSAGSCSDTASVTISVLPSPVADFLHSLPSGCAPHPMNFVDASDGATALVWSFGDGSPVSNLPQPGHTYTAPGSYPVTLVAIAEGGCTDTAATLLVEVGTGPVAEFTSIPSPPALLSFPNTEVGFTDLSQGAIEWSWEFGDGIMTNTQNPSHSYLEPGTYFVTLHVRDEDGCTDTVMHGPYVLSLPDLFIPNVFSPDGNGINDFFELRYTGDQPFNCAVFDRWGVKLWESVNKNSLWDGRNGNGDDVSEGVYYYHVTVGNREFVGQVTLMR